MSESEKPKSVDTAQATVLAVEESVHQVWSKVKPYLKQIAIVAAAALVISLLYAIIEHTQQRAEIAAWDKIFVAGFNARQTAGATLENELEKIAPEIDGTRAAFYAYLQELSAAGAGENSAAWDRAAAAAEKFLAKFPRHQFAAQVRFDYGSVLANLGKYAEAAKQYDTVAAAAGEFQSGASWLAALCHDRAGNAAAALDGYGRVANDPRNEYAPLAAFARLRLEEKNNPTPIPAGTITPIAASPTSSPLDALLPSDTLAPATTPEETAAPTENATPAPEAVPTSEN